MKKGMMKHINKILCTFVMISMLIGIFTNVVYAASFTLTSNKSVVTPNETFVVTITLDGSGKFNIVASNGTVSESTIWCDNSCSFKVTAGSVGKTTVKVTSDDVTGWDEKPITGSVDITLNVVEASGGSSESLSTLRVQIAIAEKLNPSNYTEESWAKLENSLAIAKDAEKSGDANKINTAAIDLKKAIDHLEEVDRNSLQDAINQANSLINSKDMELWKDLILAVNEYTPLLNSTDQKEIDDATAVILGTLNQLNDKLSMNSNDIVIQHGDHFCNLFLHNVWPILFFVSVGANILIGFLLVSNTKRRFNDDIPVVDYDINDDNV